MTHTIKDITRLLNAWAKGDEAAAEELFPVIERELHHIAAEHMRLQNPGHVLQATALVNEAYVRLVGSKGGGWKNRQHFFAVASMAMRHVLIDYARKELSGKRGSGKANMPLDEAAAVPAKKTLKLVADSASLVAIDDALRSFAKLDPRAAKVVELRFFGGLTIKETAKVLGVSPATVSNDWAAAQLWLMREISGERNER